MARWIGYDCVVSGTTGDGSPWSWSGACTAHSDDAAKDMAKALAFQALTGGRATFEKPGEDGCKGPYKIAELTVTRRAT